MGNKELDDLYLEVENEVSAEPQETKEPAETIKTVKRNRKVRKRQRGRGWFGFAGILIGIVIGVMACAAVFGVATMKSKATVLDLDYESKLDIILTYLSRFYIDDLDDQTIEDAIAKGLMENIGDKYAEYYTVEEFQNLIEDMSGEYAGIGVLIVQNDDGSIMVYQVYNNSPAKEAGIQKMDLIVEAEGQRDFETMDDLVSVVRGTPGTTVDIVIDRNGEEIPMTVERRYIEVESVASRMLDDTLGYLQIAEFNTTTVPQFKSNVESLLEQGAEALIMDLRDNPGGDYDSVVAICDYVVPEGPIVTVEDKAGGIKTDNSGPDCLNIPIVLLVNQNTASAAELFTMALRDYKMAEIVGERTYGKGIVQSIFQLIDGSGLKFTTERYYGPAGNCIQDTGIEPDYLVEIPMEAYEDGAVFIDEDTQLNKAAEILGHTLDPEAMEVLEE